MQEEGRGPAARARSARAALTSNAAALRAIIGLSERRADAVMGFLQSLGIGAGWLKVIAYEKNGGRTSPAPVPTNN